MPGYRELCCLPTEYPNSSTLRRLPQHKLSIKLGAPEMLIRSTCRPSVWTLQWHNVASGGDTSQHACGKYSGNVLLLSRIQLLQTDAGVVPLDNLCITNVNLPSSKCNAKLQLAIHEWESLSWYRASRAVRSIIVPPRAVDCHDTGLQVVPEMHSRPSWDPTDYVLLFLYGTCGFHLDIPKDSKANLVTAVEYYCWRLMQRDGQGWTSCSVVTWNSSG